MQTYKASRLSGGNKLLPDSISLDNSCITFKNPALLGGEEKTIFYQGISSVDIKCPFVGFSCIYITTIDGEVIIAKGFTRKEVYQMKDFIQSRI